MKIIVGTRTSTGHRQMAVRVFRDGTFRVVKYSRSVYLSGAEAELAARAILAARGVFVAPPATKPPPRPENFA